MPKMKTDKGAAERVKITGTGRLRRRPRDGLASWRRSLQTKRRLGREADYAPAIFVGCGSCSVVSRIGWRARCPHAVGSCRQP